MTALPLPGEAHAKLAKRLAGRVAPPLAAGEKPRKKETGAALLETQSWEAAGLHCSANERRADEASRDVEAWLKCKYMREHLGEEFAGTVTAATSFGLFVTLDELYVEGLVHITELGGEYFRFDELRQELRGERTGIRFAIGTRVRVQVSRVDLDGRRIDFRLVNDGEDPLLRAAMRDKGVVPTGERGLPAKHSDKRAARKARDSERGNPAPSPIQALKASVKKAAGRGKKAAKPRSSRR